MKTKITKQAVAVSFLSFLNSYTMEEEKRLLELEGKYSKNASAFYNIYRPLTILLWMQALQFTQAKHEKEITAIFLDKLYNALPPVTRKSKFSKINKQIENLSKVVSQDNGIVTISIFCVKVATGQEIRFGAVTTKLTKKILSNLKLFIDTLTTYEVVDDMAQHEAVPVAPQEPAQPAVPQNTATPKPSAMPKLSDKVTNFLKNTTPEDLTSTMGRIDDDFHAPSQFIEDDIIAMDELEKEAKTPLQLEDGNGSTAPSEALDEDIFEFVLETHETSERRAAQRLNAVNILVLLKDTVQELQVKDISATGMAVMHEGWRFELKQKIAFDLIHGYQILLKGVRANIVRIDDEVLGCQFDELEWEETEKLRTLLTDLESPTPEEE